MNIKIVYKLFLIASIIGVMLILPQVSTKAITDFIRLALILIVITEITILFKKLFFDTDRRNWVKNVATVTLSTIIFLLLLEFLFMFIPLSQEGAYTLAARVWHKKYWNPINSYGYRDDEPVNNNKGKIFFIGDSFTAGHGVKCAKDRFSDIVKEKFLVSNKSIEVINIGVNGYDTNGEYWGMINFINSSDIQPDFLVLEYLGNDIVEVAKRNGVEYINARGPYQDLNPIVNKVVQGSYLLNYIYWRLPKPTSNSYLDFILKTYSNDSIFYQHTRDIKRFLDYSNSKGIPLVIVLFPFMKNVEGSKKLYIDKIKHFLDENGGNYIDISPLVKDLPLKNRIASSSDGHPSKMVNKLVGDSIFRKISKVEFKNK